SVTLAPKTAMFRIGPAAYVGLFQTAVSVVGVEQATPTTASAAEAHATAFERLARCLVCMGCSFSNRQQRNPQASDPTPAASRQRLDFGWAAAGTAIANRVRHERL